MHTQKKQFNKKIFVPLVGFGGLGLEGNYQFKHGITIKSTSTNLLRTLPGQNCEDIWETLSRHEKDEVELCEFWLINEYQDTTQTFTSRTDSLEDDKISLFILCIWLIKSLGVSGHLRFKFTKDIPPGFARKLTTIIEHEHEKELDYTDEDINRLRNLWPKALAIHSLYKQDPNKCKRLFHALCKIHEGRSVHNYGSRLIVFTIALESLFLHERAEVTYLLSNRIAWFLGIDNKERGEIFRKFKKIYSSRSSFVHGDLLTRQLEKKDMDLLYSVEESCRQILLKIFETTTLLEIFTSGEETIRDYLDSLTLGVK